MTSLKCQTNGGSNKHGLGKIPKFYNRGGGGGLEIKKWLKMVIRLCKEQKQAVIKHKTKYIQMHAILPWVVGGNGTNKESNKMRRS